MQKIAEVLVWALLQTTSLLADKWQVDTEYGTFLVTAHKIDDVAYIVKQEEESVYAPV